MKTVFITGASSGIGRATAYLFQQKGWNVIATMRNTINGADLSHLPNVKVIACDVLDDSSIQSAIQDGLDTFEKIDVLVNNAGYYTFGPLEAATKAQIKRQIDTNLSGTILTTQAIIPHFRSRKEGVIVNLSSIAGVITVPLQTLYHATKWGIEGFSESLQHELRQFNIRVKIIEPGVVKTDFYGRSMIRFQNDEVNCYQTYTDKVFANIVKNSENGSDAAGVATTIYTAATDHRSKLRYPTGNSKEMAFLPRLIPQKVFTLLSRYMMEK